MHGTAYFLCGSQRSGSNVLCELLSTSGVAGRPTEHFVPAFPEAAGLGHDYAGFEQSRWARDRGIATFPEFFEAVLREGSTSNGVFGSKLMWNALSGFLEKLGELPVCHRLAPVERLRAAFPKVRFISLRRRNRVRQAVSWALAGQTGHYASHHALVRAVLSEPAFDLPLLDNLYGQIREAEQGWQAFFEQYRTRPLQVWYEDFANDLESALSFITSWLGVRSAIDSSLPRLEHQPQATALNAEWEARFRALRPAS